MDIRNTAVAGQFYSADPLQLTADVANLLSIHSPDRRAAAKAVLCPHAGYVYSGAVAGQVFASIEPPQSVILMGPDHYGLAQAFSLYSRGIWKTPLGNIEVDTATARALMNKCALLRDDPRAHSRDHCLEVQLPFLQKLNPFVRIVPILIGTLDTADLRLVGHAIGEALLEISPNPLLLASSDMNHFEPLPISQKKDRRAIRALLELDEERLMMECQTHNITMCGLGPSYVALVAAKRLGARRAELIDYRTSADVGADENAVVGYAGIVIW